MGKSLLEWAIGVEKRASAIQPPIPAQPVTPQLTPEMLQQLMQMMGQGGGGNNIMLPPPPPWPGPYQPSNPGISMPPPPYPGVPFAQQQDVQPGKTLPPFAGLPY